MLAKALCHYRPGVTCVFWLTILAGATVDILLIVGSIEPAGGGYVESARIHRAMHEKQWPCIGGVTVCGRIFRCLPELVKFFR